MTYQAPTTGLHSPTLLPFLQNSTDYLMLAQSWKFGRGGGLRLKIRLCLDAPRVCAPELTRFKSIKWQKRWSLNLASSGARARSAAA